MIAFISIGVMAGVVLIATCPLRGLSRVIAPDVMAAIMLLAIFAVRPLIESRFTSRSFYGYIPSEAGQNQAVVVGSLAMVFLLMGALVASTRFRAPEAILRDDRAPSRMRAWQPLMAAMIGAVAYVGLVVALAGPDTLRSLAGGRSEVLSLGGIPELVFMAPLTGSIAASYFMLSRRGQRITPIEWVILVASVAISVVGVSQLGNRRFLIPAALIPIIAGAMRKPVNLRVRHVAGGAAAFTFLAIVPLVRAAGARRPGENLVSASVRHAREVGPEGVLRPVFASYDTEMFDYVALVAPSLGEGVPYGLGRGTLVELLARPLPSAVNVGDAHSDVVMSTFWGGGCGDPVCPVASAPGVLYFDGGLPLVALGCFVLGYGLRRLALAWKHNATMSTRQALLVAIASGFALVAMRTNTVHALWWIAYAALIAAVLTKSGRPQRSEASLVLPQPPAPS